MLGEPGSGLRGKIWVASSNSIGNYPTERRRKPAGPRHPSRRYKVRGGSLAGASG